MKPNLFFSMTMKPAWAWQKLGIHCASVFLLLSVACPGRAGELQTVRYRLTAPMTNSTLVARSLGWKQLNLAIGLPLRNQDALNRFIAEVNDPASPNFRHYLTPEQFAQRFGPTEQDYEAVARFAQAHRLRVTGRHPNRVVLDVSGTAMDIERAFHVKLHTFQHPTEPRTFYAPDTQPTLDLTVPVLSISGLDNFQVPQPMNLKKLGANEANGAAPQTGSGASGSYMGYDFRAAYLPGVTLTGTGQTVGLLEFDSGFYPGDITRYESLAGLPNVPVQAVLLDGYNGGAGIGNDEVSLDIEMAIAIAPGLSAVLVYEGSATDDILNRMATDNLAKQIGASWTYPIDATSEQIFKQYAAQGQSFYNASGDSDAYTGNIPPPSDDTNIICVGGTTLTTSGPGGVWVSETVWNWGGGVGSSGGISTSYAIPAWQQGIDMGANQGSTTMRNFPDVAMTADNIWVAYGNGQSGIFGGTSCATPLWAGFTALANQLALANGEPLVGFVNPAVYALGKGSNSAAYATLFHDITTGNNESPSSPNRFSAVPGYDLCTGWGTPTGSNLLTALALPEPLRIVPGSTVISGPAGGPFSPATINYTLSDSAASPLNWSLVNTSVWLNVFPTSGALTSGSPVTVTASLTAVASNLPAGSYFAPLQFSNRMDHFVQTRQVTLAVVTPPVITAQPTNQAVLTGMAAAFSVGTGPNALLLYQWRDNGTNLTDGGKISGSTTASLTISNVTSANVGNYSVVVSNAAGVAISSNASLAIVPSPPVIVLPPTNQTVLPGAPVSFSVAAVGDTPYSYRWQFNGTNLVNGVNLSGATNSTLLIKSASPTNAGTYSVIVSNTLGSTSSPGAVLSIISVTATGVTLSPVWSFTNGNSGEFVYSPVTPGPGGLLYGTTIEGGTSGYGTVYRAGTNGSFSTLAAFNFNNGAIPYAGLVFGSDGSFFYGTTYEGGTYGDGTIFRISLAGSVLDLASFNGENGMLPVAGMVQGGDGSLYGTTLQGGAYGYGTIFKTTTGGSLTTLVSFDWTDGAYPSGVLVPGPDGNFYGTTENGGAMGNGTVFKISPAGAFTLLYSFAGGSDGAGPIPGLTLGMDGNFYGNTITGGSGGYGTVFQITSSGTLTTLYAFTNGIDGANPWGGLVSASDGNLYGTTQGGGSYGDGTVFRIAPQGSLVPIAQFDNYEGANPSAALVQSADGNLYGTTYQGGAAGDGVIYKINISGPLQITGQPADQSAYLGGTAAFTVATFGGSPVSYQWQQDGVNLTDGGNISGANTATLRITNVTLDDAAFYSVVVSNSVNSVTSEAALLEIVYSPPHILSQPANVTCVAGMTATFGVTATGDLPLIYQWQENGTNLADGPGVSGSTGNTLTLTGVTAASAGTYSVIISNPVYTVTSAPAILVVVSPTASSASQNILRQFTGGSDGAFPYAGVVQAWDGKLYGVTTEGGSRFAGTLFRFTPGGGLTTLYSFTGSYDGANPYGPLLPSTDSYLYGTTFEGGTNGYGAVYRMSIAGNGAMTPLYSFTGGIDGGDPYSGLIQGGDGSYYGTTFETGANNAGTVFKVTGNGAVTALYEFTGGNDGALPYAGLIQGKDGNLYGTTLAGGVFGEGTVFQLNTNGTLATLVSFNYANGGLPEGGLCAGPDGSFYGTTYSGGSNGYGTVFRLATNGTLTTLIAFNNTNGAYPIGTLMLGSDGNLYGTTSSGGPGGQGSVFQITTNGALTTLLWFDGLNGAAPQGTLLQAKDGTFYGTTPFGGTGFNPSVGGGYGTLFQLIVPIFVTNSFSTPPAIGALPYSASISGKAVAPPGDGLSFSKAGGPAWLNVAANGALSGTPANSDIGTNLFVVRLTDTNGASASAGLTIVVTQDPPPSFLLNPFTEPFANVNMAYSGSIATNGYDLELPAGDVMTFAKVTGPAWLNVGADGTLSGTPQGTDDGTNVFVVSVTNLGGLSNTALLFIYVNGPPYFTSPVFTRPAATVGLPYSGTIATNANDPDLNAGDVLTFYKVTGPAWLNVSADGGLSGTPGSGDVGAAGYLLLVVDSGGLAGVATLNLTVTADHPPVFTANPFTAPHANPGQPYTATIAASASDPDFGDVLTFAKVSGASWLSIAPNGALSGTPAVSDTGTNAFMVSVTDFDGLSSPATMLVDVAAPISLTISRNGGQVRLDWTGGYPPYQVECRTNIFDPGWDDVGGPINSNSLILTPSNPSSYFRVQGR